MKQQKGDRLMVSDHGEEMVVIPRTEAEHNFGPASDRDAVVYTCERPGGDPGGDGTIDTDQVLPEWIDFIKNQQGVTNVIVLLGEDELSVYDGPGLMQAYQEHGMTVHHVPYSSTKNGPDKIMDIINQVQAKDEKVVAHCTHGMGRSGRVAALWLVKKYGLSAEESSEEVLDIARKYGVERMGAPRELQKWMDESAI